MYLLIYGVVLKTVSDCESQKHIILTTYNNYNWRSKHFWTSFRYSV